MYHTLRNLYVCVWLVNTLTSTTPIVSPMICMWSPADICEQWGRNLSFSSADVRGAGTRDETLRTSAWETIKKSVCGVSLTRTKRASCVAVSPHSHSPFSASFQTFCLTARAYLNTQKYGLFCSLQLKRQRQQLDDTSQCFLSFRLLSPSQDRQTICR